MKRTTAIVEKLNQVIDSCGGNLIEFRGDHFLVSLKISKRTPSKLGRRFVGRLITVGNFITVLDELLAFEWYRQFFNHHRHHHHDREKNINNNNHNNNQPSSRNDLNINNSNHNNNNKNENQQELLSSSENTKSRGSSSKSDLERDLEALLQMNEQSLRSFRVMNHYYKNKNESGGGGETASSSKNNNNPFKLLASLRSGSDIFSSTSAAATVAAASAEAPSPPWVDGDQQDKNSSISSASDPYEFTFTDDVLQKITREIANSHLQSNDKHNENKNKNTHKNEKNTDSSRFAEGTTNNKQLEKNKKLDLRALSHLLRRDDLTETTRIKLQGIFIF